ncbi:hypothetical protein D3C85_685110 [compost metagenome]
MQGGVVARVVGKHCDGEHAAGGARESDAVTRFDLALPGNVLHILQADGWCCRCSAGTAVGHVFGMVAGHRHRRVFHGPGYGLAGGGVEAARLFVGLGHVVPHRGREAVPDFSVFRAPETGPGHAAEQHHQQQCGAPESGDRVQVTPEHAAFAAQPWPQNSGATLASWPPQEDAGHDQHDAPARGHLDQSIADGADHQLAMNGPGDGLQVVLRVLLAQDIALIRVDEHVQFAASVFHDELRAAFGVDRRQVLGDLALWISRLHTVEQRVGAEAVMAGRHIHQAAVHQWVELRLEQVNDAGQGQHHHERRDEQPGIKMPAPGQVVEVRCGLLHYVCSAGLGSFRCSRTAHLWRGSRRPRHKGSVHARACPRCVRSSCPPWSRACAPVR